MSPWNELLQACCALWTPRSNYISTTMDDSRDCTRASRIRRNQWHSLQLNLGIEVLHCPLNICNIEPKLPAVSDVHPDRLEIGAIGVLIWATAWRKSRSSRVRDSCSSGRAWQQVPPGPPSWSPRYHARLRPPPWDRTLHHRGY